MKIETSVLESALGRPHNSPEIQDLFSALGISEKDLEPDPLDEDGRRIFEDAETLGIQLEFEDEGISGNAPYHVIGEGPWILDQMFLLSSLDSGKEYSGEIPCGLNFKMSREQVRETLGAPTSETGVDDVDAWNMTSFRLVINYEISGGDIRYIGLQLFEDRQIIS